MEELKPTAGCAVRLTGVWPWAGDSIKVGEIGIIDGVVGEPQEDLTVIWHYSAFRGYSTAGAKGIETKWSAYEHFSHSDDEPEYVSCSGGPGTICLPANLLRYTGETVRVRFWCWECLPKADGGVDYWLDVPLFEWDGKGY